MIVFVVVGRLGKSLVESKVLPIANHAAVKKVYIFSETSGYNIDKAEYLVLPGWLTKMRPALMKQLIRIFYEFFQLLYWAIKIRPLLINGIYTLPKGLNAMIASKIIGCKSMVSVIGNTKEIPTYMWPTFLWKNLNLWLLRMTDAVATKGCVITRYLIDNHIEASKIFEFGGGLDLERFRSIPGRERDIDVLFVGNYSELKGPDRVVSVIERLRTEIPDIRGVFLGNGPLFNKISLQIIEKNLTDNIYQAGQVDNTIDYYQKSKLLIMPSKSEGLSTAMIEAMACGCVAIISNVGAMKEAAKHNVTALVVENYQDINQFYYYANQALINDEKRRLLSKAARSLVEDKYSIEAQTGIFDLILRYIKLIH
jgi:L-malate glycosyltransferase